MKLAAVVSIASVLQAKAEPLHNHLFIQQDPVSQEGKVVDSEGMPLPGVEVRVVGSSVVTVTNGNGQFTIKVKRGDKLKFHMLGYVDVEKVVDFKSVTVTLVTSAQDLNELVVVGYGTQKKVNLLGAVAAVKVDEQLTSRALPNVSSALQGMLPGLAVNQTSGMAGNNSATLLIRGLGTVNDANPLIVVDGMPDVNINRINMNDVESVSVLKDAASAAVYGSRGANGVILITTKSGKGAQGTKINASVSSTITKPTNVYEFLPNYAKALTVTQRAQAVTVVPASIVFKNGTIDEWLAKSMIDPLRYPNTNWWDLVTRNGQLQNYNISATGGNEKSNFYLSVGVMDEKGIQIENDFNRYNALFSYDAKIKKNISTGVRFSGNWSNYKYNYDEGFTANGTSGLDIFTAPAGITPYDPITGYYGGAMAYNESILASNPYVDYINRNKNNLERQEAMGNVYIEYNPIPGLKGRVDYNLKYGSQFSWRADIPSKAYNFQLNQFNNRAYVGDNERIYNADRNDFKTQLTAKISYDKLIAKHHEFSIMGAYSEEFWKIRTLAANKENRYHPLLHELDAALGSLNITNSGASSTEGMRSYIGRFNYSAYNKYLFEFNLRIDGSSKFIKGYQYGSFPSAAVGWRFTEESFIKSLTEKIGLTNGKLRASYGSLGNNNGIGLYEQQEVLATSNYVATSINAGSAAQSAVMGFQNRKLINRDLTWEKTTMLNLGLDMAFFGNRLTTEFDYYDRLTTGMIRPGDLSILLAAALSPPPRRNLGDLRNRGVEANLTWKENRGDFGYMLNINASYNTTLLEKWPEFLARSAVFIDMPYYFVYAYQSSGIAQTWEDVYNAPIQSASPGDILLKDINGDGRIDHNDQVAYPNFQTQRPTTNFAFRGNVSWKGFDLGVMLQGATGRKDYYNNRMTNTKLSQAVNVAVNWNQYLNTWAVDNRDASLPRLTSGTVAPFTTNASTFWLDDVTYLRLKNLQLGYTFDKPYIKKLGLGSIRIYGSADNLATITNYRGLDPEKVSYSDDVYPLSKTFVLGLNVEL
ncbi:TonB-dependent receptor [Pedobacter sp. ASV1-7]|uniref:SusC/RagA family TonB-linked outer membrane protein n=1 Tax=Pedobacter sp. ASV1-7 TaxID=3145237 RepID=UPI0032E87E94